MIVDIYLKEKYGRGLQMRIPWLPEEINYESGGTIRVTYDILNRGPVEVATGSGLRKYSWESIFPGTQRTDKSLLRGTFQGTPAYYHDLIEYWRENHTQLTLLVTGYPINLDVIVDDYNGRATGAFGDIAYEIKLIEDRDISIHADTKKEETKRPATQPKSYTVKPGDNLWKIAQNELGKGSRHKEIYNLNKEIIETTAKKHGYKNSNEGWWIFPNTSLTLPQ